MTVTEVSYDSRWRRAICPPRLAQAVTCNTLDPLCLLCSVLAYRIMAEPGGLSPGPQLLQYLSLLDQGLIRGTVGTWGQRAPCWGCCPVPSGVFGDPWPQMPEYLEPLSHALGEERNTGVVPDLPGPQCTGPSCPASHQHPARSLTPGPGRCPGPR